VKRAGDQQPAFVTASAVAFPNEDGGNRAHLDMTMAAPEKRPP
jgi:hypothetical protein